jgi:hypothetical protein
MLGFEEHRDWPVNRDTTSTYFERDTEEAPSEQQPAGGLRRYGHSKDSRPDLPQIVIGLAVTREGIPVRCWVWPGNTADVAVLPEVKDDLRGWRLGRVVTVVDRGFSSKSNLDYLRRAGGHWIAGERMRDGNPQAQAALSRQGRYRAVRDNLRVKEVRLDEAAEQGSGVRWIVCHNPVEAERDKLRRDQALTRLAAELERIKTARLKDAERRKAGKKAPADAVHVRAECALRDHPTLAGGCVSCRPAGSSWTAARSLPRSGWTASTCCPPPTRTCPPRTSRWATRTCSRLNAASVTSRAPWSCGRCSTASNRESGPTYCCAGWRCCSSASPNAAPA